MPHSVELVWLSFATVIHKYKHALIGRLRQHSNSLVVGPIGLIRYIAVTNLPIIAVFVEYLRQFLIDLNETYHAQDNIL